MPELTVEISNLVFYLELCKQYLFNYTIDILKTPLNNTHTLLNEYMRTYKDADNGLIPYRRLVSIRDEIASTAKDDAALRSALGDNKFSQFIASLSLNKKDVGDNKEYWESISNSINYIIKTTDWADYLVKNIIELRDSIGHTQATGKIEKVARRIIPELHSLGYSYEYIYFQVNKMYRKIRKKIKKNTTLYINASEYVNNFMMKFSCQQNIFSVYFIFEIQDDNSLEIFRELKSLTNYLTGGSIEIFEPYELLSPECGLTNTDLDNFLAKINNDKRVALPLDSFVLVCVHDVKRLDIFSAKQSAHFYFNFFTQSYYFVSNEYIQKAEDWILVYNKDNNVKKFIKGFLDKHIIFQPRYSINTKIDNKAKRILPSLAESTRDRDNFSTVYYALDLHNSSIRIDDYQSSYLCLWTALEVICGGGSKVNNILSHALVMNYLRRKIGYAASSLFRACKREKIDVQLDDLRSDSDLFKFYFTSEFDETREVISSGLFTHPLERYQLWSINKLNSTGGLEKELERYGQRVSWHIDRMYRARNSIVHAGQTPANIKELGEHLHSYLDVLLDEVLAHFHSGGFRSVSEIISGLEFEYEVYRLTIHGVELSKLSDQEICTVMRSEYYQSDDSISLPELTKEV